MGNLGQVLGQKEIENWLSLFEEIWINAIKEELDRVTKKVGATAFKKAYDVYIVKGGELEPYNKRFRRFKKDISDFIRLNNSDIKARVQELIYTEAQDWPKNSNKIQIDEELKALVKELEILTIDFARERMLNRWNKI